MGGYKSRMGQMPKITAITGISIVALLALGIIVLVVVLFLARDKLFPLGEPFGEIAGSNHEATPIVMYTNGQRPNVVHANALGIVSEVVIRGEGKDFPALLKGYEFIPGTGTIFGWLDGYGNRVYGTSGNLVFCKVYTHKEIANAEWSIDIIKNVTQSVMDSPTAPCPSSN